MKFIYQARDQKGELKKGFVVAETSAKAEQLLANNGLIIINMQVQQESFFTKFEALFHRVSYKDLVIFSRQLATLVGARVPILQGLRILQDQVSSKGLVIIIQNLITGIEGGQSLSLAMSRHPDVFGNVYISLVKSGEAAGGGRGNLSCHPWAASVASWTGDPLTQLVILVDSRFPACLTAVRLGGEPGMTRRLLRPSGSQWQHIIGLAMTKIISLAI